MKYRSVLLAGFLALAMSGCEFVDDVSTLYEQSLTVGQRLTTQTGTEVGVSFKWNNGSLYVNVVFTEQPKQQSLAELMALAKQEVLAGFKQKPDQLVISFVVPVEAT